MGRKTTPTIGSQLTSLSNFLQKQGREQQKRRVKQLKIVHEEVEKPHPFPPAYDEVRELILEYDMLVRDILNGYYKMGEFDNVKAQMIEIRKEMWKYIR